MKVFVSYTLRDSIMNRQLLTAIEQELSAISAPYIDLLHNRGPNHQAAVFAALRESSLVLACITPGFFHSPWVKLELATARNRGTPIVPLMLPGFREWSWHNVGFHEWSWPTGWPAQTPRSTKSRFADSGAAQSSGIGPRCVLPGRGSGDDIRWGSPRRPRLGGGVILPQGTQHGENTWRPGANKVLEHDKR